MTKHRTMRGQEVDIDLIKMKQELMKGQKTDAIIKREDHINDRRRRSSSKRINEMLANEQIVRQKLLDRANETAEEHLAVKSDVQPAAELATEGATEETPPEQLPKRIIKKQGQS